MALPKTVKVGGRTYRVRLVDERDLVLEDAQAEIEYGSCEIRIMKSLSPAARAECLCHELLHALWHDASLAEEVEYEEAVRGLGFRLAALFTDDPAAVRAIMSELKRANA